MSKLDIEVSVPCIKCLTPIVVRGTCRDYCDACRKVAHLERRRKWANRQYVKAARRGMSLKQFLAEGR